MRSEQQKQERKDQEKQKAEEYKIFFQANPSLKQKCKKCQTEKELEQFVSNHNFKSVC